MADKRLTLSAEPDGFGFHYGWAERDGERVRVDVLPPEHLWRGDVKLDGQKPDPKAWVLYLDGEEFARVERREDLAAVLGITGPSTTAGGWGLLARLQGSCGDQNTPPNHDRNGSSGMGNRSTRPAFFRRPAIRTNISSSPSHLG